MKKTIAIAIVAMTLVGLGFWCGAFLGRRHTIALESSYQAALTVHMLDRLHAGDTNRVATILNDVLDQNTVAIGKSLDRLLLFRVHNQINLVIPRIQIYRDRHPREHMATAESEQADISPEMQRIITNRDRYYHELNIYAERVLQHNRE